MKKYLIGLLSLCFLPVTVNATPEISPPAFMQAMRPPQAKTRFFGEVKFPTPVHNDYYLHFYEFPRASLGVLAPDRHSNIPHNDYIAELFTFVSSRKAKYKLVSRVKFDNSYFDHEAYAFDKVSAEFIWLRPNKRQIPVLSLACTVTDGFNGDITGNILFVFNKGFSAEPVRYGLYQYCDSSECRSYDFNKIDSHGFRVINEYYSSTDTENQSVHSWNGKSFVASPIPPKP